MDILSHHLGSNLLCNHFHELLFYFDTGDIATIKEVVFVFFAERTIFAVSTSLELIFEHFENIRTSAVIFTLEETMLLHTLDLCYESFKSGFECTILSNSHKGEGIFGLSNAHVVVVESTTTEERSIRLDGNFIKTLIDDLSSNSLHIVYQCAGNRAFFLSSENVMLKHYRDIGRGSFFVGSESNNRSCVVFYIYKVAFGRILGSRYISKNLFEFLLYIVYIDIPNYDNTLEIGTIPLVVEVADFVVLEVVYYFHCTNRHAICILVIGEHFGELSCKHTQACIVSRTPFFVDHPTLFVNLFAVECNVVAPVVHDKKTAIDNFNPLVCRSIHYSIYCFVKCSVSIEVCPKLATNALQESNKVLPGEVLRPVECHVLKKVSKPRL